MSFFLSCRSLSTLFRFQLTYSFFFFFFFNDPATTEIYTLSLHDALPISGFGAVMRPGSDHFHPDAAGFYHLPYITIEVAQDRKSTRLNSSHLGISYAVFCLKKKKKTTTRQIEITQINKSRTPHTKQST